MREEASWLPAQSLRGWKWLWWAPPLLLLKLFSQQLVLQGPTEAEAEGSSLGNLSQCWLHCCSLPKFALFFNSLFLWQHFWHWKSLDSHLRQWLRKRNDSEAALWKWDCLSDLISISAFKSLFVLLYQRKNADRRIESLISQKRKIITFLFIWKPSVSAHFIWKAAYSRLFCTIRHFSSKFYLCLWSM